MPWQDFFDRELFLPHDVGSLHLVHHAYISFPREGGPLFVTHHGAGSSGLSFAAFTKELREALPNAGVLSLDARGHGLTTQEPEPSVTDFALETLTSDLSFVVNAATSQMGWTDLPDIVLIGHSLGGAVTTDLAQRGNLGPRVLAYAVLDVVEGKAHNRYTVQRTGLTSPFLGSALDALQSMETYLSTRPTGFPSIASGIEWQYVGPDRVRSMRRCCTEDVTDFWEFKSSRSRTIRNQISARVSVPALLYDSSTSTVIPASDTTTDLANPSDPRPFKWRTDLSATKPFWEGWFTGLSSKFLTAIPGAGKLLLLAGTDRLDKELMIGQMQGKYQLQVFPEAGHFVHEDQPAKTAQVVADFFRRNDRGALVLPPKVGAGI